MIPLGSLPTLWPRKPIGLPAEPICILYKWTCRGNTSTCRVYQSFVQSEWTILLNLYYRSLLAWISNKSHRQGVTQDLETGGQNWGFLKFRGSKVSYPIYKNDHSNLIYWLSKTKCASLCHLMYLLSSRSETFSLDSNKYRKSCKIQLGVIFPKILCLGVWESKWLPGSWLGKSQSIKDDIVYLNAIKNIYVERCLFTLWFGIQFQKD